MQLIKSLIENSTRKEIVVAAIIGVVVLIISILPYWYGYHITPAGKEFMGIHGINENDTYTYLSWIQQAREGHFLFKNLYTAEAQPLLLLNPIFLIIGFFAFFTHVSNIIAYHAARILVSAGFLVMLYIFISKFFTRPAHRLLTFAVITTSSGLGIIFGSYSTDWWAPETITFLNIYESVLNTFSLALILTIFIIVISKFKNWNLLAVAIAALCMNLLILTHTYDFIFTAGIIGLYCLLRAYTEKNTDYIRNIVYLILFSFPAILWQAYVLVKNTSFALWATLQSHVPAAPPALYVFGYGLLIVFGIMGMIYAWRQKNSKFTFLYIWVFVSTALLYLPFLSNFQRKFTEGLHIPIAILASLGIIWVVNYLGGIKQYKKILLSVAIVLVLSLTNFAVIGRDLQLYKNGQPIYYINQRELDSVKWLKNNTSPDAVILGADRMGNLIPGIIGRSVYMGNNMLTSNYNNKHETLQKILERSDLKLGTFSSFLATSGIDYILVDSQMLAINKVKFDIYPFLSLVYENTNSKIYKVN